MKGLMMDVRIRRKLTSLLGVILLIAPYTASAQNTDFPTKPVRIFVGWEPAGIVDIAARVLAQMLTARWGQQVIVENRPGAAGIISAGVAANSPADGYTLVVASSSEVTTNRFVQQDWKPYFDRDLVPVALLSSNPSVLVTGSNSGLSSVQDVISVSRARPATLSVSTTGTGTASHLAAALFAEQAGIELQYVPYKGGAPAAIAVAGGDVPLGLLAISSARPHVQSGTIKSLGVLTRNRVSVAPDWPTIAEAGLPGFEYDLWTAVFARTGTPGEILEKIATDVRAVVSDPSFAAQLSAVGAVPPPLLSAAEFANLIKNNIQRDRAIIGKLGL